MKFGKGANSGLSNVKFLLQRFAFVFLVILAFCLMLLAKADDVVFRAGKKVAVEVVVPTMYVLFTPVMGALSFIDEIKEVASLREINQVLRMENQRLTDINAKVNNLERENAKLTKLLNYKRPPETKAVAAKVIADLGGAFAQSLVALVGADDGVGKGDIVMMGEGVVGRIAYVSSNVSQILLISDVNSRIPVFVGDNEYRAILAGDNTEYPRLIALSEKAEINIGDKVVTSSDAGVFPFGLLVGSVVTAGENDIRIQPVVDRSRLEFVTIIDFGLKGILEDVKGK